MVGWLGPCLWCRPPGRNIIGDSTTLGKGNTNDPTVSLILRFYDAMIPAQRAACVIYVGEVAWECNP